MSNKIIMLYDNSEYKVLINGEEKINSNDCELAFNKFKELIKENQVFDEWNVLVREIEDLNNDSVNIDKEHQSIEFNKLKYFYKTNKVFYSCDGQMIQFTGGKYLIPCILRMVSNNEIKDLNEFIEFLKFIIEAKASYRVTEGSIIISSASFNYGSAEFTFANGRINKGASIKSGDFKEFKEYVNSILK
ncbi:MAG: hypothetical protein ACRC7N_02805 [Clostridium sp.]